MMQPWGPPSPVLEEHEYQENGRQGNNGGWERGKVEIEPMQVEPGESSARRESVQRQKSTTSDCIGGEKKRFHQFAKDKMSWRPSRGGCAGGEGGGLRRSTTLNQGVAQLKRMGTSFSARVQRVFSEDYQRGMWEVRDPRSKFVQRWNAFFIIACIIAVFVDPLFYFLPSADLDNACIYIQNRFAVVVTFLRTIMDLVFLLHILLQFKVAYVAPSSRVLGRGELVVDKKEVAKHYLKKGFLLDVIAVLPVPQTVMWIIIPAMQGSPAKNTKNFLRLLVLIQYIPRVWRIFPLISMLREPTGVVFETAWAGIVTNLAVYMIASHVAGACWYLLTIERVDTCWRKACVPPNCEDILLDCGYQKSSGLSVPKNVIDQCMVSTGESDPAFNYGIYTEGVENMIDQGPVQKYFYALWWALRNVSSLGSNLDASSFIGEVLFCIAISLIGLLLLALLVGNMQTYLLSLTRKLEEMRVHRRDIDQWLRHRQLPKELQDRVRRFEHFSWSATRGVDEEERIRELPPELRRDIKRHLCLDLVRKVPLFNGMDEQLLDAICVLLRPTIFIQDSVVIHEGDPVKFMLFIIRGVLESSTTNGGRTGFLNTGLVQAGSFCGEELLTWCLDRTRREHLPSSTRTITALVDVEAFALEVTDLKYVASQFKRLHRKEFMRTLRYHSLQWRTWAACSIQAAWRRKKARDRKRRQMMQEAAMQDMNLSLGTAMRVARFAANAMKTVKRMRSRPSVIPPLFKPPDPIMEEDDIVPLFPDTEADAVGREVGGPAVPKSGFLGSAVPKSGFLGSGVPKSGFLGGGGSVPKSGFLGSGVPKSGFLASGVAKSGMLQSGVAKSGMLSSSVAKSGLLRGSIPPSGVLREKPSSSVAKSGFL